MSTRTLRHGLLIVNSIVLIASAGCQTMTNRMAKVPPQQASASEQSTPTGMAKTDFHREISRDQQFNVHVELAKVHESQGNNDAALAEYEQAIAIGERRGSLLNGGKLGPDALSLAHRRMAATYDRMGRFALAETHYNQALKLTPNDPKVWNDAGYSYYLQNRLADAERTLKTAKTFAPNDARILTNLGMTLAVSGKSDEALGILSQAGGPAVGRANLGYILASTGRTEQARKQYEAALAMQPDLAPARQALAKLDSQPKATAIAARDNAASEGLDPNVAATSIPNAARPTNVPPEPRPEEAQATASAAPNSPMPDSSPMMSRESMPAARLEQTTTTPAPVSAVQNGSAETSVQGAASSWIEPVKTPDPTATQPTTEPQSRGLDPVANPVASVPDYAPPPSRPVSEPSEVHDNSIPLTVVGENDPAGLRDTSPAAPPAQAAPRSEPVEETAPQVIASRPSADEFNDPQVPSTAPAPAPAPTAETTPPPATNPAPAQALETSPAPPAAAPAPAQSLETAPSQVPTPAAAMETAPSPEAPVASAQVSESVPAPAAAAAASASAQAEVPPAAPGATETATEAETPDPADLQNPFPPGMNQILATPQNGSAAKPSDPGQAAYPSKTAPAAAPAQAPARMASPSKIQPIPRQAMVSPSDSLPTSNPVSPYGTGTLDPNTKSLPATTAPALGRGASTGAMMSRNGAGAMNPTPSKSQPNDYVDAAGRPYRTQPVPPSKVSPAGTVPGWAVPKNYRSATYPPTPSDLATRATRKTTPPAAPANTIPPTPW